MAVVHGESGNKEDEDDQWTEGSSLLVTDAYVSIGVFANTDIEQINAFVNKLVLSHVRYVLIRRSIGTTVLIPKGDYENMRMQLGDDKGRWLD